MGLTEWPFKEPAAADLTISRSYYSDCTIGRILSPHFSRYIASLELPWLDNINDHSCIKEGLYTYHKAWSNQAQRIVIWIEDKHGRTLIQIHPGNFTRQILGCILPGFSVRDIDSDGIPDVVSSGDALDYIMSKIPDTGTIRFIQANKPGQGVYK